MMPPVLDLKTIMNDDVRKYLSKIGGRGGAKRKDHPDRSEMARKAANTRWHSKQLGNNHANSRPNEKIIEK